MIETPHTEHNSCNPVRNFAVSYATVIRREPKVPKKRVEPAAESGEPFNFVHMSSTITPSLTTTILMGHRIPSNQNQKSNRFYLSSITWGVVAQSTEPGAHVLNARAFRMELEFRKCWFLRRGENRSTGRKTSRSREENQQQTQPTYDVKSGNRTRATLVEGECSHHCTIPAPVIKKIKEAFICQRT